MTDPQTTPRRLWLAGAVVVSLLASACSGDGDTTAITESDSGDTTSGVGDAVTNGSDDDSGTDGDDGGDGTTDGAQPDNDDAADILGNPDLDTDDLPDDVADALDAIDDVVSIGECQSETLGIGFDAPDGWKCRVLDQAIGGLDGFTLFTEGNQLNITVGTPSPIQPCEVLQLCDSAEAINLSDQFPDTKMIEIAGTVMIWGRHASVDAEVVITNLTALTDDEVAMIRTVLDSTMELG